MTNELACRALVCHIIETLIRESECYARHELSMHLNMFPILYRNSSRINSFTQTDNRR